MTNAKEVVILTNRERAIKAAWGVAQVAVGAFSVWAGAGGATARSRAYRQEAGDALGRVEDTRDRELFAAGIESRAAGMEEGSGLKVFAGAAALIFGYDNLKAAWTGEEKKVNLKGTFYKANPSDKSNTYEHES